MYSHKETFKYLKILKVTNECRNKLMPYLACYLKFLYNIMSTDKLCRGELGRNNHYQLVAGFLAGCAIKMQ